MKKEELVSIIMPAYNCEKFIGDTLDSVLKQTYKNWEVIVIDDCSTDNTADVVTKYIKNDKRIRYYKLIKNSGAAIARNRAVEIANGKYIAFLDSDDIWFPGKLTKQIYFMKSNKYDFTCTSYDKIDEKGDYLDKTIVTIPKLDYDGILKICPGNSTVIYNAKKLGKFKIPDIKKRNDYVMWLFVVKKAKILYGMEEPLASHRIRSGSLSKGKVDLIGYHWKIYRDIEKLPLLKSFYLIMRWVVRALYNLR